MPAYIFAWGIDYLTVVEGNGKGIDWQWLRNLSKEMETEHIALVGLKQPFTLKADGRQSRAAIYN